MSDPNGAGPAVPTTVQNQGRTYWEGVDADVNGMLGGVPTVEGFSHLSKVDLQGSRSFLAKLGIGTKNGRHIVDSALEGGAGIGRVTEGLLVSVGKQIDVIEPVAKFTAALQGMKGVRSVFTMGLEDWAPSQGMRYDLVWIQWCVGYLTDEQLVRFFEQCKASLNADGGFIVVKENLSSRDHDIVDELDGSITRDDRKFRSLFVQAGLQIMKTELQKGFPQNLPRKLFPVRMYALKPKKET